MFLVRASVSSIAATVVDGLIYQAVLLVWAGRYGTAAAAAAAGGAITNFALNRRWTFAHSEGSAVGQAVRYVVVSLLTYLCLRGALWLLIEALHVDMRLAWLPGKLAAFALVSYPLQRWWVFKPPLLLKQAGQPTGDGVVRR